ncbi:MAG: hypothetical protein WBD09_08220 [Halobacteriota archaeon]
MSEEESGKDDVEKLKHELKELIDYRVDYNNDFVNLLRGDYSLFIALIALFLSVYGAWKLEFLAQHYVLSVYLMFGFWLLYSILDSIIRALISSVLRRSLHRLLYSIIDSLRRAPKRAPTEREIGDLNKLLGIKTHLKDINLEKIKVLAIFVFKGIKPLFFSFWVLFLLSLLMLLFIGENRLWLWMPLILFTLILPLAVKKVAKFFVIPIDEIMRSEEMHKITPREVKWAVLMIAIVSILVLAIIGIYLYYVLKELFFIVLENPSALFEVILTMLLILISLAFLSEYLSMKFMVNEVSNQNHKLSMLRMGIDRIEGTEALEKEKKELLKWYLPKADSFLFFFNYYGLMPTKYTFEVGEEEEEEESSGV